jgi:hypothetical protein
MSALSEMVVDSYCGDGPSGLGVIVKKLVIDEVRRRKSSRTVAKAKGRSNLSRTAEKGVSESYSGVSNDSGHRVAGIAVSSGVVMHKFCS